MHHEPAAVLVPSQGDDDVRRSSVPDGVADRFPGDAYQVVRLGSGDLYGDVEVDDHVRVVLRAEVTRHPAQLEAHGLVLTVVERLDGRPRVLETPTGRPADA